MGEDMDRASVIRPTPKAGKVCCPWYRRTPIFFLGVPIMLCLLLACPHILIGATKGSVSRLDFLEQTFRALFGREVTELEIMQADWLDPYPDGRHHLDWPITRGTAAIALYRLLNPDGGTEPLAPRGFSDVNPGHPCYLPVQVIGQAFDPIDSTSFKADQLITRAELTRILARIAQEIHLSPHSEAQESVQVGESRPLANMYFSHRPTSLPVFSDRPLRHRSTVTGLAPLNRLQRAARTAPAEQLAPAAEFDLDLVNSGVAEIEQLLTSIEGTVFTLVDQTGIEAGHDREIRTFLSNLAETLAGMRDKLRFSLRHLQSVLLTDPARLAQSDDLRLRIGDHLGRLERLQKAIAVRLKAPPITEESP
jgi:hypothetical protein